MSLWRRRKNEKLFVAEAADDRVPWILISWLTCYIHFSWSFIIRCNEVVFQYFATTRATHIYIYLGNWSYYNRFYSIPDQVKRIRRRFLPCIDWLGKWEECLRISNIQYFPLTIHWLSSVSSYPLYSNYSHSHYQLPFWSVCWHSLHAWLRMVILMVFLFLVPGNITTTGESRIRIL